MAYIHFAMQDKEPGGSLDSMNSRFPSAGRGIWASMPGSDWNDWHWQLKHRITTLEQLEKLLPLTNEERLGVQMAGSHLALAITPYFFNLIDAGNPSCPIRRQVVRASRR